MSLPNPDPSAVIFTSKQIDDLTMYLFFSMSTINDVDGVPNDERVDCTRQAMRILGTKLSSTQIQLTNPGTKSFGDWLHIAGNMARRIKETSSYMDVMVLYCQLKEALRAFQRDHQKLQPA